MEFAQAPPSVHSEFERSFFALTHARSWNNRVTYVHLIPTPPLGQHGHKRNATRTLRILLARRERTVYAAAEEGINLFFAFGFDLQMTRSMRELMMSHRERYTLVTGAYNYIWWAQDVRKAFEKRLRQFKTDYIDVFLFMGVMKPEEFTPRVREDLLKLKGEGKVRAIGLSCHNRPFLGKLAADGDVNTLMLRYNAAHRGAERDVFPHLAPTIPA